MDDVRRQMCLYILKQQELDECIVEMLENRKRKRPDEMYLRRHGEGYHSNLITKHLRDDKIKFQNFSRTKPQDEELANHKVKVKIETDMDRNWNIKQEWLEAWEEPVVDYDLSILKVETKDEITTEDHSISLGERSGAFSNASTVEEKSGPGICSSGESLYSVHDVCRLLER